MFGLSNKQVAAVAGIAFATIVAAKRIPFLAKWM